MKTFGYGDKVVNASSIKEGLLIIEALEKLDEAEKQREYLRSIKHYHEFNLYNRLCNKCGLLERDYRFDPKICEVI